MSLFCRRRESPHGSCDQLLAPRSLVWKKTLSVTKETQTSLSIPWNLPSLSSFLKLFCLVLNFGDDIWTFIHCLPPIAGFLNKATFRFHPAVTSQVLAFEWRVAKFGFLVKVLLPELL